jgi:hypothetical protein
MTFENLQEQWAACDKKLEQSIRLNTALLRESRVSQARSALRWLSPFVVVDLLVNLMVVIALGAFIASHVSEVAFVAPAIVLDAFEIGLVVACARQLAMLAAIDFGGPIVASQKSLETLRRLRIRKTMWTLILAPALWTPLVVVGLEGVFGVNAYSSLGGAWLVANALFGVAVIPVMVWVSRRFADRMAQSPFVQRLMNDIAGRSLTGAKAFLDQLAIFEREDVHAASGFRS